jgi:ADP-ribosylglycohydrolase
MARTGSTKEEIRKYIEEKYGYDLHRTCDDIRPTYYFNGSCQGTVPEAIVAFLDSRDYEDAIRLAVTLGGDSDTLACITGGIAEAFYKEIPSDLAGDALDKLPPRFVEVIGRLQEQGHYIKTF